MNFEFHQGDLLNADEPHIAHGVNLRGVMGAGIAGQIARRWPATVERLYQEDVVDGILQYGGVTAYGVNKWSEQPRVVWNLGTQYNPGPHASLAAVGIAFHNLAVALKEIGVDRIAIPRIGCGIDGLDWDDVAVAIIKAVDYVYPNLTVAVYDYTATAKVSA